jgi:serine/threonine protein kinase
MEVYPDLPLNTLIGQYRIRREVARGGMGVVYEACHEVIGQRAAVKLLRRLDDQGSAYARLLHEARVVSLMHHPGLVRIFDFGRLPTGTPYLLMEFIEGELLRTRLASPGSRWRLRSAVRIARQLASTLAAVHARGIVHRDLKPENVMLVPDEEVDGGERARLLDFGIARLVGDTPRLSAKGTVQGTALYMAPEQCAGDEDLDGQVDVYALGVLLYELVAQEPPFRGQTTAIMRQHLFQEPPLLPVRVCVPEELRQFLRLMLSKAPSRRPRMSEAAEFLRNLERAIPEDRPLAERPVVVPLHGARHEPTGVPTREARYHRGEAAHPCHALREHALAGPGLLGGSVSAPAPALLRRPRGAAHRP